MRELHARKLTLTASRRPSFSFETVPLPSTSNLQPHQPTAATAATAVRMAPRASLEVEHYLTPTERRGL